MNEWSDLLPNFATLPPASEDEVRQAELDLGLLLPDDYKSFLLAQDGGEGFVGEHYLILWKASDLAKLNEAYNSGLYAPGLVLFGSSGGGECFAFDTRSHPYKVLELPFVGMSLQDSAHAADSFTDMLRQMRRSAAGHFRSRLDPGTEIFEIQPIILGGSPTDEANKAFLTRAQHIEVVRFWNIIVHERRQQSPTAAP